MSEFCSQNFHSFLFNLLFLKIHFHISKVFMREDIIVHSKEGFFFFFERSKEG
jgi:hypothetical protein